MPGGLLNLIAVGQQNIILNGSPKKTFWKTSYSKYTNFGMQKFRLDFNGLRKLRLNDRSTFTFKYPRYGDLVMDTYLVVNLPHIWSPLYPIKDNSSDNPDECNTYYIPYNFKWIENIGTQIIESIEVNVGGTTLQKYSGDYLTSMINRDFSFEKKQLINQMTGNIKEMTDPANAESNTTKAYPNAVYNQSQGGAEPSIRGRQLYIPLNLWFGLTSKQAFPLVSLQYNELSVTITLRSIRELFVIRDVKNPYNNYDYVAPNFNEPSDQMYIFLQTPQGIIRQQDKPGCPKESPPEQQQYLGPPETTEEFQNSYVDRRDVWDADIHLITTYCFLSDDERRVFAANNQEYIIKEVYEKSFHNIVNSTKLKLDSLGMVSSWMWFGRRSDANLRNQWTNYTNWKFPQRPTKIKVPTNNSTARQPWYIDCSIDENNNSNDCNDVPTLQEESSIDCNKNQWDNWKGGCQHTKGDGGYNTNCSYCISDGTGGKQPSAASVMAELDCFLYQPYSNFQVVLPQRNPYASSNFNIWQKSVNYQITNPYPVNSENVSTFETVLDQKGYYPPSVDIICDQIKGPYVGAAEVSSTNGLMIEPVWIQQGSINTNYPLYCKNTNPDVNGVNLNYPCGEKYDLSTCNSINYYGNWWGSPYHRTTFPLAWGTASTLPGPFSTTGKFSVENERNIVQTAGILLDGKYRENLFNSGVYNYVEKYQRSGGGGTDSDGLLCYNFCLHTNPFDLQPSGAINMSRFSTIEIELTTHTPPIDKLAQYANICTDVTNADGSVDKVQIGVNKPSWNVYEYTYDIHLMEERYNIVKFTGGNVGLMFTR